MVDVFIGHNMVCGHDPEGELSCIGDAQHGIMDPTAVPEPLMPEMEAASNLHGQLGSEGQGAGWTEPIPVWDPPGR